MKKRSEKRREKSGPTSARNELPNAKSGQRNEKNAKKVRLLSSENSIPLSFFS